MMIRYKAASRSVRVETKALKRAKRRQRSTQKALKIAQTIAESIQRDAHSHIAGLVTRCLSAVFGDEAYQFRLVHEQKRNRTEVRAVFVRDGEEMDPMSETGGGAVDVAAFALRLSVLMMRHPPVRRAIIADEPFRFVSEEYRPRLKHLIELLASELDMQIILVTHLRDLECGKIVRI